MASNRWRNTDTSWGRASKLLHWLTALFIVTAITLGWVADSWPVSPAKANLFIWHKSIGITVLGLAALRLVWKLTNPTPAAASGIGPANARLARLGHGLLYLLLVAVPLSGWLLNSAANFPFKWMGLVAVPNLIAPDEVMQERAETAHFVLFWLLLATLIGHVGAALWHHYRHGSDALVRMLPAVPEAKLTNRTNRAVGIIAAIAIAAATISLTTVSMAPPEAELVADAPAGPAAAPLPATPGKATASNWVVDHANSRLGFVASYDGVAFDGVFDRFSAVMRFDPADPKGGLFDVTIDTTSVDTDSADRDMTLKGRDWFHFAEFPTATFVTDGFARGDSGGYTASGTLTIKNNSQPVALPFTWEIIDSGKARMRAETTVNRLDFGLGARDWGDDDTIGFEVRVVVDLSLQPAARQ